EGGHEQLRRYEITGLKLDGSRHPIEVSVSSITLQNDIATIAFIQDITERKKHEERILSALREKEVLLREVHHRVKNNMAIISSLLSLQAGYINESNYLEKFMETRGRIRSMAMVHEKIYRKQELSSIDVKDYIESLIEGIELTFAKRISINNMFDIEDVALDIDTLIPCGLIINEIITNASKYAFDEQESPQIIIRLRKHDAENIQLTIEDNGKGFPEGFDISKSDGLGLKLVEMLTGQLNAKLDIKYTQGPRFTFTFPKHIKLARP
ncbi:MAG: PAS domain S-box protein, partial [candidate division Zixibacteria bacterium]|nr:PAS domain S-box protein [candidate division Zixibacteria bacterium]NIR66322.1 PAS domain S-box protein [candidate division Zixibacteria bacterium]NIS47922.1 PAS domain S-box protein [candidate division Zixibacteria bacterium]NIU16030.1 PAS domain S-box protein [candidate division Zixibacteria bacterium]NIV08181.1 PAS domain S-box protein [candidate division Zixibacteria bacterium]